MREGIKGGSLAARGGISEPVRLYYQIWNSIRTSSVPPFLGGISELVRM